MARASILRHYLIPIQGEPASPMLVPERRYRINGNHLKETTMRKTVLTILAASLFVGSTIQIAGAAERYTHKIGSCARAYDRAVPQRQ